MTITFITGANRGLGFETARRLIERGHTIYIGGLDPVTGIAAAESIGARFVQLDITEDDSVEAAAAVIESEQGRLDVLINNAGVTDTTPASEVTAQIISNVLAVNVVGTVRVTHAFLPLLGASASPVIVNVSSSIGSLGRALDPGSREFPVISLAYGASKAAVTALTVQYAKALPQMRINAADPGYTATDMTGFAGVQTVQEGTDAIVQLATLGQDGPTATFIDRNGTVPR